MNQQPAPASEKQPRVILTTPRLILRAAVEEDISVLQNLIFGDSDVMRFAFPERRWRGTPPRISSGDFLPSA
jgi:ribosomal-protein-alanine N-acetyltransferase